MCNYFSCILTQDGRLLFTEDDSHSIIIERAGLDDSQVFLRSFVRLECEPPFVDVDWDEDDTLPPWFAEDDETRDNRVRELARRVDEKYQAHCERRCDLRDHKRDALAEADRVYGETKQAADAAFYSALETAAIPVAFRDRTPDQDRQRDEYLNVHRAALDGALDAFEAARGAIIDRYYAQITTTEHDYRTALRAIDGYLPPAD